MVACNKPESEEMWLGVIKFRGELLVLRWNSSDPSWIGKASMCLGGKRHLMAVRCEPFA